MKRILFRGNFQPDLPPEIPAWSTEHHVALSLESLGHEVVRVQENTVDWSETVRLAASCDLFLWTCTYSYAHVWDQAKAHRAVNTLNNLLPTAMVHLDKWFDLDRESQLQTEPWTKLQYLFTADGGNQDRFAALGINHFWMPPAVYAGETHYGTPRADFTSDIAFVGSWRGHYHKEWRHRMAMLSFVRRTFPRRVKFWPQNGAIRGQDLNDLYASVKVLIGDSCLTGGRGHYFSDRIPETLGRGGFLIHPEVGGVMPELFTPGEHLGAYKLYDWSGLRNTILRYLNDDVERERVRHAGHEHVKAHHTYAHRMAAVLDVIDGKRTSVQDPEMEGALT